MKRAIVGLIDLGVIVVALSISYSNVNLATQYAWRVFNDPKVAGAIQQAALALMAIYHLILVLIVVVTAIFSRLAYSFYFTATARQKETASLETSDNTR